MLGENGTSSVAIGCPVEVPPAMVRMLVVKRLRLSVEIVVLRNSKRCKDDAQAIRQVDMEVIVEYRVVCSREIACALLKSIISIAIEDAM